MAWCLGDLTERSEKIDENGMEKNVKHRSWPCVGGLWGVDIGEWM